MAEYMSHLLTLHVYNCWENTKVSKKSSLLIVVGIEEERKDHQIQPIKNTPKRYSVSTRRLNLKEN